MKKILLLICASGPILFALEYGCFVPNASGQQTSTIVRQADRISDREARLALARALSYNDASLEDSLAQYRVLLVQAPADTHVQSEAARVLIRLKRFDEARALLLDAMRRGSDNAEVLTSLGDIERYSGSIERSIAMYRMALKIAPRSKDALLGLSYAFDQAGDHAGSLKVLSGLYEEHPDDISVALQLVRAYISNRMPGKARPLLQEISAKGVDDPRVIVLMADIECETGHAGTCRDLYLKALGISGERSALEVQYADRMNIWGDFYGAESIYRKHLSHHPGGLELSLKLARVLASSQRYEEAESLYRDLILYGKKDTRVFAGLAASKLLEKDFESSIGYAREAIAIDAGNMEAARILAQSLIFKGNYREARDMYERIASKTPGHPGALIDIGKSYLKENETARARQYFEKARSVSPDDISVRFYEKWPLEVRSRAFLSSVLDEKGRSPDSLVRWADLYLYHGLFDEAIYCYEGALKIDPDHFPASIGLAETLAMNKRYDRSIALYQRLSDVFPDNLKILMGMARALAWSKRYDESIALYRRIILLNPADPVPRREMARTAMWGKMPGLSFAAYDAAMNDLGPDRRIKRSFYLEKEAKRFAYNRQYARSLPLYEALLDEYPGNEEAIFDRAQVMCALGLCGSEKKTYEKLLNIDPLHGLAGDALERLKDRGNPSMRFDYSYWNEEGRGDLARITRNRFDLAFDLPIACQYHMTLKGHRWLEHPDYTNRTYGADGFSIGFSGVFNPFVKGEASWTYKKYDSGDFGTTNTGYGTLWFNVFDLFSLGAGYARTDELYNYFGLDQRLQADRIWGGFQSNITRRLVISGKAEYINYTDSNSGSYLGLSAGYAFTDHPRIFKVMLSGELRNTRHDNEYIYRNGFLTDIIHPYWAPRGYSAGSIILEWRHDLSKLFICGAEQHYYDIKTSFGTDSEDNPYAKIEGEWNYEFKKHWALGIKGMVHSSPEWNATGAWALLRYRF